MIMRENNNGIFNKVKIVTKRFLKGVVLSLGIYAAFGIFIPRVLAPAFLIPNIIKGGITTVLFGFIEDAAWKFYDHILESEVIYEAASV